MKTFNEFIKEVNGTSFDYDGVSGVQCVDLIKRYLKECFGLTVPNGSGNAEAYWNDFKNKKFFKDFIQIKNTPTFIPERGDIMVWNKNVGNGVGHIAICTGEGNTSWFNSYDLNWGGKTVRLIKHDYKNVYGVIRKKESIGNKVSVPVLFTGARDDKNSLVEFKKHQFWISNEEFNVKQSKIIGTVCFEQELSIGLAFHYYNNGAKKEFQMNILKSDIK